MTSPAPGPAELDGQARAELLCYLVVAHLVAFSRTGEWLRTDHLVESMRLWLAGNGATLAGRTGSDSEPCHKSWPANLAR